jgi:hypothetical protein
MTGSDERLQSNRSRRLLLAHERGSDDPRRRSKLSAPEYTGRWRPPVVRIGSAAREQNVKSEMGEYRILHFATHAVLDDQNPLCSYLVLAPGSDRQEDGLLEAWELAMLSACDTGRRRVGSGEGSGVIALMPLTRNICTPCHVRCSPSSKLD